MSALPTAVQKQIERANQLSKSLKEPPSGETPAGAPPPDPASATPAAPAPPKAQETPPSSTPAPGNTPPAPQGEDWEQRYKVLQGKYNAEVPRLNDRLRDQERTIRGLQDQINGMQGVIASLGAQPRAAEPAASATPAVGKLVKDEEIRDFGPDLIDVMRRVAQETILPEIDARVSRGMQPIVQKAEQATQAASTVVKEVAKSAREKLFEHLAKEVPEYQQMDGDEGFNNWLDQTDPYSGEVRREMLNRAFQRNDGPRVAAFFKGYRNEHAVVSPSPSTDAAAQAQSGQPAPDAPQRTLEEMVAPGTPKAPSTGAQEGAGKRIWTRAEITQFYNDVRAGRYRKNPKRQSEQEQDIFAAQREGRVR